MREAVACRVYHTAARDGNVWQRLAADTATRKALPSKQYAYVEGSTAATSGPEGWAQNVVSRAVTQPAAAAQMLDPPLDAWHHTKLEQCRKGQPLQFYSTTRPRTRTVNQTMRCASLRLTVSAMPVPPCGMARRGC